MVIRFILLLLFVCCAPQAVIHFNPPTVKSMNMEAEASLLDLGLLTEYDIWEFLKSEPEEREVLEIMGSPDSVWVSSEESYYILYYYRPRLKDYNSVELDKIKRRVTGYEWDE
ncbi:MAG: hypothetical protein V3S22_03335, partial [Candidatus Neomarinimicrobiota bacterium]